GLDVSDDQMCPDGVTKCSLKSTCCPNTEKNQNGQSYGCCPYQKGVCCGSRGDVCCPFNYICNPKDQSCELNDTKTSNDYLLRIETTHAEKEKEQQLNSSSFPTNVCPNLLVSCPDNYTCCETSSNQYQCCAFTNGTCCGDGLHCCPY
ncbi:unnamed protein product, partial [Didymodactylos carnosus]